MHYGKAMIFMAAAALIVAAALANAGTVETWGGNITKAGVVYYTFDGSGLPVSNSMKIASPKGPATPNTVLSTVGEAGPPPLTNMSITASVNGRLFLSTSGELLSDSRGVSGHSMGEGVLLLDSGLSYDPASEELNGSGRMIYFPSAIDIAASIALKNGVYSGAAKLGIHPASAHLVTVTDGVPDFEGELPTKVIIKSLSVKFTQLGTGDELSDYSGYAGLWDYIYTVTASSDSSNPDIGVPQAGTLTLDVSSGGEAGFTTGNDCGSAYAGRFAGPTMALYSADEAGAVDGVNCGSAGTAVVTFSDADNGAGNVFITDPVTGAWTDATLTLTRSSP